LRVSTYHQSMRTAPPGEPPGEAAAAAQQFDVARLHEWCNEQQDPQAAHAMAGAILAWRDENALCGPDASSRLDLYAAGLPLPPQIGQLANLTSLVAHDVGELPPEIGNLQNLRELDLSDGLIDSLPAEIGNLTQLTKLYLSRTPLLESLPADIGKLAALETLALDGSGILILPAEIGQLAALKRLDVSMTELTTLPPEIGSLQQLVYLALSGSRIGSLPAEIGQLRDLESLVADGTEHLRALPFEITHLQKLHYLTVRGSGIVRIPSNIIRRLPPDAVIDPKDAAGLQSVAPSHEETDAASKAEAERRKAEAKRRALHFPVTPLPQSTLPRPFRTPTPGLVRQALVVAFGEQGAARFMPDSVPLQVPGWLMQANNLKYGENPRFAPVAKLMRPGRESLARYFALTCGSEIIFRDELYPDVDLLLDLLRHEKGTDPGADRRCAYYFGHSETHAALLVYIREGGQEGIYWLDSTQGLSPTYCSNLAQGCISNGMPIQIYQNIWKLQHDNVLCRTYAMVAGVELTARTRDAEGGFGDFTHPNLLDTLESRKTLSPSLPGVTTIWAPQEIARMGQSLATIAAHAGPDVDQPLAGSEKSKTLGTKLAKSVYSVNGFVYADYMRQKSLHHALYIDILEWVDQIAKHVKDETLWTAERQLEFVATLKRLMRNDDLPFEEESPRKFTENTKRKLWQIEQRLHDEMQELVRTQGKFAPDHAFKERTAGLIRTHAEMIRSSLVPPDEVPIVIGRCTNLHRLAFGDPVRHSPVEGTMEYLARLAST
jgi:Leucine-rich repeat (LRR) protein